MKEQLVFNFSAAGLGADSFLPTRTCLAAEDKLKDKQRAYQLEYRKKNKERINQQRRAYYLKNRAVLIQKMRAYRIANIDSVRAKQNEYSLKNKEKKKAAQREYYKKNPEKHREFARKYRANKKQEIRDSIRKKRQADHVFRLLDNCRRRLNKVLRGKIKSNKSLNLIGCSVDELKAHLQSKFKPGMTWANHGKYGWHIDHIRPCSSFDLSKPEEQAACFHYTNLQPLWAYENLSKSDKFFTSAKHCLE